MKRFVLFVVMVLMFGFINVNKGECKVIKTENVNVIGESYSYNEAGMMWYGLKVEGKDIPVSYTHLDMPYSEKSSRAAMLSTPLPK